ncbi:MAG: type II toxin-antitoxin system Phd/YefM family antitoxin [Melioribacteraceae bacterium]|nr:type II toxin-antitoxin system Phd/YefM family antitoxin [Melioribacteraceae bacterium]MCF8263204.1 type II toxin-antitoxin system Phd/YefM family antitoxin [Melioribacteraceae bacterium]MCF8412715.1 type II toxin-antitoxin system Phd/YefM family antitoxin [Melioribacteraceae bacterium]MCF8431278.1 type II toxin-antitoxin system Phd/YefM family antitoxin [Melioribacteraceae bacterium]
MAELSVNYFRANLKRVVEDVIDKHTPIRIKRRAGRDVVVISAEDWERTEETIHVLQNQNLMTQMNDSSKTHKSKKGYKPSNKELDEINSF